MARMRFTVGTRYLLLGQVYCIRQVLLEGRLLIENQSYGGLITINQGELIDAWGRGELRFEVRGPHVQPSQSPAIATSYTLADFEHLPAKVKEEAWRRYQLLLPLLRRPPSQRSRSYIIVYAATLRGDTSKPANGLQRRARVGEAISWASIERWLRSFIDSGYDIRSLVTETYRSARKGEERLDPEVETIVTAVLEECAANPSQRTVQDVYLTIINRIAQENRTRPADQPLHPPGQTTVYRRVHKAGITTVLRRARSRAELQAEASVMPGPEPSRILERVEIDHTLLDLFIVDEEDRLPIGRPTLTFALDSTSGMPVGIYVGFEPPSYSTVMQCLMHAILPKPDTRVLFGTQNPWIVAGLMETLVVDNAKEFTGQDLENACAQLGIILERLPIRTPWFKGSIERFFRTNNTGLIHSLPGSTFSNVLDRGDYDVFQHSCISLTAFWKILHIFLLDIYAQRWHDGVGGIPAKKWNEGIQNGFMPSFHHDSTEIPILLARTDTRVIGRSGIEFETLRYQSPDLARLRSLLLKQGGDEALTVSIKYDPTDISAIHIYDTTDVGRWLRVPALDQSYTHGLSLWKHRIVRKFILAQQKEVNIEALAAAKAQIQQIVAEEFALTRKTRGRKSAARFLGIGVPETSPNSLSSFTTPLLPTPPQIPPAHAPASLMDAATSPNTAPSPVAPPPERRRERQSTPANTPRTLLSPPGDDSELPDKEGWGGDYNLPRLNP